MSTGFLAAACLCVVLGEAPTTPETTYSNARGLRVPVDLPPALRTNLREMLLFASPDQGRSWAQAARITPDKSAFAFYPPKDGVYWLRVARINQAGVQVPDEKQIMAGPADQIIIIDTVRPIMRSLSAQRDGEDVYVKWDVQEEHPDRDGFRLVYQAKDSFESKWTAVPVPAPTLQGSTKFRTATRGPLIVRLTVRDAARNESYAEREVEGAVAAAGFTNPPPVGVSPSRNDVPSLPIQVALPQRPIEPVKLDVPPPVLPGPPPGLDLVPHKVQMVPRPPLRPEPTEKVIADSRLQAEPPKPAPTNPLFPAPGTIQPPAGEFALPKPHVPHHPVAPEIRYVNRHQVMLQYKLTRVGPSGVGGVQVWMTKNDGTTWKPYAELKDFHGEASIGPQERPLEFRDDRDVPFPDGIYGLTLVVRNRAGLGRTPKTGDAPEIRVEIDTRAPVAQLFKPRPDPQQRDHVLLKWFAEDKNLAPHPIHLEYAEKRDGPWLPIQTDLDNNSRNASREVSGEYSWKVPANFPVQVYLRLRVRDKAGNESVAVSSVPEFLDLTEPEGTLIGVQVK